LHYLSATRPGAYRRHRARRCLLKGCEQWFLPSYPQARYCSDGCRQAARRWRRWQASQRYRASTHGKERRRLQQRRYRQRCRQRQLQGLVPSPGGVPVCVGQRPAADGQNSSARPCARPGCYELLVVQHECSGQRFCSLACRRALRRVLDREARYRQRRQRWRRQRLRQHGQQPDTS
jgi:hypothetical protein